MNMIAVHNNVTQNDAKVAIRAAAQSRFNASYQILITR